MSNSSKILEVAVKELGTRAHQFHDIKYNDWYYGKHVVGVGYAWCATFLSWCANQAGIPESEFPHTPSVRTIKGFFRTKHKQYHTGELLLHPGIIAVWNCPLHIGIICEVSHDGFYTIEGNVHDRVSKVFHTSADSFLDID